MIFGVKESIELGGVSFTTKNYDSFYQAIIKDISKLISIFQNGFLMVSGFKSGPVGQECKKKETA